VRTKLLTPEVYAKAADLIEEHGLSRGSYYHPKDDCYCVIGAIAVCAGVAKVDLETLPHGLVWENEVGPTLAPHQIGEHVADRLGLPRYDYQPDGWTTTTRWSDSRSKEEVVAALREVAQR
jgi:hypothetical protein